MSADETLEDGLSDQASEVFNQSSIDDFLGLSSGFAAATQTTGIDALLSTQTVPYERIPRLEAVFDRLVKQLRQSTRRLTSDAVEIRLDRITSMRFGRYLDTIALPALLGIVKADPWNNFGLMTVDSSLVYALTDVVFGGTGDRQPAVDGRSFSSIEMIMIRRFLDVVMTELQSSFKTICDVTFALESFETNPRFISITQPQNVVLLVTIKIELGVLQGYFDIVLPFATLEPIRDLLDLSYLGESAGTDQTWQRHFAKEVVKSRVELTAVMHEQTFPLRQILRLAIGDTLYFDTSPERPVQLRRDKTLLTEGMMGRSGDRIAIQLTRPVVAMGEDGRDG